MEISILFLFYSFCNGSYSHATVNLQFKPLSLGEFDYEIHLQNKNDYTNDITIKYLSVLFSVCKQFLFRVRAIVRDGQRDDFMLSISTEKVDFGDCYTGVAKRQAVTLTNNSSKPMELRLGSDLRDQVSRELQRSEIISILFIFQIVFELQQEVLEEVIVANESTFVEEKAGAKTTLEDRSTQISRAPSPTVTDLEVRFFFPLLSRPLTTTHCPRQNELHCCPHQDNNKQRHNRLSNRPRHYPLQRPLCLHRKGPRRLPRSSCPCVSMR